MSKKPQTTSQKERFLKVALRLFAKNGYAATSTRQICDEVGLAHSAMYNYFPSKEAILMAIEEREMLTMQAGLDAILSANPGSGNREKVFIAMHYSARIATDSNAAWRLMADMLRSLRPKNRAEVVRRRDHYEGVLRDLIKDYLISRNIDPQNADLMAKYFFGTCEGISGWFRPGGARTAEEIAQDVSEFFLTALDAGRSLE